MKVKLRHRIKALGPAYWFQMSPVCKHWDKHLKELALNHDFVEIGKYTARLGGHTLWIENTPYSCFHPWPTGRRVRPKRSTIAMLIDKLGADAVKGSEAS